GAGSRRPRVAAGARARRPAVVGRRAHGARDRDGPRLRARGRDGVAGRPPALHPRARRPGRAPGGRPGGCGRYALRAAALAAAVPVAAGRGRGGGLKVAAAVESAGSEPGSQARQPTEQERDAWRGVAAEEVDDLTAEVAALLRRRSRVLLGSMVRPHGWGLAA